ncbi:uncharacterized protein LOC116268167, partial [Nymphaea colorata]
MTKKAIHCSTDIFDNQRTMGFSTLAGGIKNVVVWSGCIWLQSLLIHWPNTEDSRFMLSSVAPPLVLQFNDQIDQSGTEFQDCNVPLGDVKVHSIPGQNLLDASSYCELHGEADCCNKFDSDIDCIDQPKAVSLHNGVLLFLSSSSFFLFEEKIPEMLVLLLMLLLHLQFRCQQNICLMHSKNLYQDVLLKITYIRWRFVEIDADLSKLDSESKHVMSLISPANTYM